MSAGIHRSRRRAIGWLRKLRRAADTIGDALVLTDADDRIRWLNRAADHLLGLRRPGSHGQRLGEQLGSSELGAWWRGGGVEAATDIAAPLPGGPRLSAQRLPLGAGDQLLLVRDISPLNRLEQMRRDFVANVSHELRTPLTVIHGYLELIAPEDVPALAPVLHEMRTQSRRMGQIVEDLLTLSRLETQQSLPDEHVAMTPLLDTVRREAEALSQGRHRIELHAEAGLDLLGSLKDLHSAFSNLVSNAVRYTPSGGSIVIRWQRTATGADYAVSDTGYGIPADHLTRLTERFYRVSSSRSRETGGTGLGLSIVKHVLSLHQARLGIESQPGAGSTFTCQFGRERLLAASTDA
ncbi:MAG TPA: phosphate regulon sensor histidine kinase PhoR [Rhodanobacteraceae bacterium]|nr:phosphate regulon sensor histidine kinase PhoR [Rhodanobacteraceae bacterium]